jgi:hypothetical protein
VNLTELFNLSKPHSFEIYKQSSSETDYLNTSQVLDECPKVSYYQRKVDS